MAKKDELLKFSCGWKGYAKSTAEITIIDKSYPTTYITKWTSDAAGNNAITSVNEGQKVYFVITGTNITDGTVLNVILSTGSGGGTIDSADLVGYNQVTNVTINNNKGVVPFEIANDDRTDGTKILVGTLRNASNTVLNASSLTINDTSLTPLPTYTARWYSTSAATTEITSINEGSTAWLVVTTTNVPNGTVLSCRATGAGASDFDDYTLDRSVTINNNIGRTSYPVRADSVTDGNMTLSVSLYQGNQSLNTSASITINDTSKTPIPTYTARWYSTSEATTEINNINEGSTAWLVVTTTNINDNHGLGVKFTGTAANLSDISGTINDNLESVINISNNVGRLAVAFKADLLTEGEETLIANIYDNGVFKTNTPTLKVNDISTGLITITPGDLSAYGKKHINLKDFFKHIKGRDPFNGEVINFVLDAVIVIGTMGATFNAYTNPKNVYYPATSFTGFPGLTTDGWSTTNDITITLTNGAAIVGSPATIPARYTGDQMGSGLSDGDASILLPRQQYVNYENQTTMHPAVYAHVPLNIVVNSGCGIYGGGGNSKTLIDALGLSVSGYPGDALYLPFRQNGGIAFTANGTTITVTNSGTISGGGAASGGYGLAPAAGIVYSDWASGVRGGSGAPYGGFYGLYNEYKEMTPYYLYLPDSQPAQNSTTDSNGITSWPYIEASLLSGAKGERMYSPSHGNWIGGNGANPGSNGVSSTHTGITATNADSGYKQTGGSAGVSISNTNSGSVNISGNGTVR